MIKIFITLILLLPSILFAKEEIIYCVEDEEGGLVLTDITNAQSIQYFIINDKKQKLETIKHYSNASYFYPYFSITTENKNPDFVIKPDEVLIFNDHHIEIRTASKRIDEDFFYVNFYELDRVSGMLLRFYGIREDANGDLFTYDGWENEEKDIRIYQKDDETKFFQAAYSMKYVCQKSKEL